MHKMFITGRKDVRRQSLFFKIWKRTVYFFPFINNTRNNTYRGRCCSSVRFFIQLGSHVQFQNCPQNVLKQFPDYNFKSRKVLLQGN